LVSLPEMRRIFAVSYGQEFTFQAGGKYAII